MTRHRESISTGGWECSAFNSFIQKIPLTKRRNRTEQNKIEKKVSHQYLLKFKENFIASSNTVFFVIFKDKMSATNDKTKDKSKQRETIHVSD
jgi:hypothetical protein